jgi:hypothetical protein
LNEVLAAFFVLRFVKTVSDRLFTADKWKEEGRVKKKEGGGKRKNYQLSTVNSRLKTSE